VVDLVLTDLNFPDGSGADVLRAVKELNPTIAVVIMTAYGDIHEAVELLKSGADDYLVKPTRREDIERLIIRINETMTLIREALLPPIAGMPASPAAAGIIYKSRSMASMLSMASRAADSRSPILIWGESGTGKELVARFIHERSGRAGPFVTVNLTALSENLVESELFGHRRGAFTGADSDRVGRFEEAEGGTLFLDEIGEVSLALQVKLLRAIQFGEIERLGENRSRRLDVRIVTATHRRLPELVKSGRFRQDLYYRVNVIEIRLPPLRERKEDIRLLVDHFIAHYAELNRRPVRGISREAFDVLSKRSFPGNIRELENVVEQAVVLCRGEVLRVEDMPPALAVTGPGEDTGCSEPDGADYESAMRRFESDLILAALKNSGGNKSAAARALGIGERHLRSRLSHLGID
jgi:DNA-binding NtrC family response regulator